jgi:hypothetical protein
VVRLIELDPVVSGIRAEAEDDRPWPVFLDLAEQKVRRPKQGVDRLSVGAGMRAA